MEAYRSVIMEAFRDQFTTTELLSYKEVLYNEATEECYAQREPDEVVREELYVFSSTILLPYERVQRTIFHLCSYSFNHIHEA